MNLIINRCNDEKGISLMELLIVLALSSILVEGLFTVYLQTKEHHANHYALQEITEETRFIQRWFEKAIQRAGYLGLSTWNKLPVYDDIRGVALNKGVLLLEKDQLPENIQKKIKSDTQAIELRQMDFNVTSLTESANAGASEIVIDENQSLNWKKDDEIIIADSEHAEIEKIVAIQTLSNRKKVITFFTALNYSYEKGAYLGAYLDIIYFIGDTGRKFPNQEPIYGLYTYSENSLTEEITSLVSDIHYRWIKEKTCEISFTITLPYWVNGKIFSRRESFIVANRE